ncbi:FAD-dependent monooxygenase [Pseudonocardia xinjiangensis]|uniref:FAD-dependent monooxygenase n=1 Tax=Pseudonocardia xinjiangensis TaxID=75289 RepID=UPI003D8EB44C
MASRSVLVSGASIAGPALAYWLNRAGWAVTVVERFDGLREAGQNIDVRGAGREVVRRMGLEEQTLSARTGELGSTIVDGQGRSLASFAAGTSDGDGLTAEMEILRGDFARLLHESTARDVEYVFGDQITALDDTGDAVTASFLNGRARTFDAVVVAEGLTSRTRSLVLPDAEATGLGLYMAYLTIERTAADDDWWRWYFAPGGRQVTLRPDNHGTIRATLSVASSVGGLEDLAPADQARILRRTFRGAGWETERVLAALDRDAFYFDAVGQMRIPRWSRGRVGLVGDAAYCPSPLSGMGTSLSLVGAYVLAGELASAPDPLRAFARFETLMRPYADRAQKLLPGVPAIAHPRSRAGVAALRTAVRLAGSPLARRLGGVAGRVIAPPADAIELPRYPALRETGHPAGLA